MHVEILYILPKFWALLLPCVQLATYTNILVLRPSAVDYIIVMQGPYYSSQLPYRTDCTRTCFYDNLNLFVNHGITKWGRFRLYDITNYNNYYLRNH